MTVSLGILSDSVWQHGGSVSPVRAPRPLITSQRNTVIGVCGFAADDPQSWKQLVVCGIIPNNRPPTPVIRAMAPGGLFLNFRYRDWRFRPRPHEDKCVHKSLFCGHFHTEPACWCLNASFLNGVNVDWLTGVGCASVQRWLLKPGIFSDETLTDSLK